MQKDFHYYATYAAAYMAGYSHHECMDICYGAQLVDCCSPTFLAGISAPPEAATTQLQLELADLRIDLLALQETTRIWTSFHFLPGDLYAQRKKCSKLYMDKFRLICETNSDLLVETVNLARKKPLPVVGMAMHVLADTWAHRYFAGTPSLVINNVNEYFFEIQKREGEEMEENVERRIRFIPNPSKKDDIEEARYVSCFYQSNENSVLNLGHGRAGHIPDYSFIRYKYLPAWGDYMVVVKDNPSDYWHAFCQMIKALQFLRGDIEGFEKHRYAYEVAAPWEEEIRAILERRQLDGCEDWRRFNEKLSGEAIEDFDLSKYTEEYRGATVEEKKDTYLGQFFQGAIDQKSMVSKRILESGNLLAGFDENKTKRLPGYKKLRRIKRGLK